MMNACENIIVILIVLTNCAAWVKYSKYYDANE